MRVGVRIKRAVQCSIEEKEKGKKERKKEQSECEGSKNRPKLTITIQQAYQKGLTIFMIRSPTWFCVLHLPCALLRSYTFHSCCHSSVQMLCSTVNIQHIEIRLLFLANKFIYFINHFSPINECMALLLYARLKPEKCHSSGTNTRDTQIKWLSFSAIHTKHTPSAQWKCVYMCVCVCVSMKPKSCIWIHSLIFNWFVYCDFSAHPNRMNERICIVIENVCFSVQDYYSYFIDCCIENHVECDQSTSIIQWVSLSIHHFLVIALHPQKFVRATTLKFITQLYETDTIQCVNAYELQLNSNRVFIAQTNLPVKCSKACTRQIHGI